MFAVLCRSGSACVTVGRGSDLYIGLKSGHLISRELKAEFRASPQNVVCAPRPFVVHQVVDLPLTEIGTDQSAEGVVRAEYSCWRVFRNCGRAAGLSPLQCPAPLPSA